MNSDSLMYSILKESDILAVSKTLYSCYGELILIVGFLLFIVIVIATDVSQPTNTFPNEKIKRTFF